MEPHHDHTLSEQEDDLDQPAVLFADTLQRAVMETSIDSTNQSDFFNRPISSTIPNKAVTLRLPQKVSPKKALLQKRVNDSSMFSQTKKVGALKDRTISPETSSDKPSPRRFIKTSFAGRKQFVKNRSQINSNQHEGLGRSF